MDYFEPIIGGAMTGLSTFREDAKRDAPEPVPRHINATAGQIEARLGTDVTATYRPSLPIYNFTTQDYPAFWFYNDVEIMLLDGVISTPLEYALSPLSFAEVEVEASSKKVAEFALRQWQWWWERFWSALWYGSGYGWSGSELVYEVEDDLLVQKAFNTFHSRDVQALTKNHRYVGVRVANGLQDSRGATDLWGSGLGIPAKGFWYAHNASYGMLYGRSQLRPAWRYWRRLRGRDGIEEIADLGLFRMGVGYIIARYPEEDLKGLPGKVPSYAGGNRVASKDVARGLVQSLKSGAGIALPSSKYDLNQGGDFKWDVKVDNPNINLGQLQEREDNVAQKISRAIGWPPELMDAAETGSGFSGRMIPFFNLLNNKTRLVSHATTAWADDVCDPLLKWNYGPDAWAKFKAVPLVEIFKKMGVDGQQPGQSSSPGFDAPGVPQDGDGDGIAGEGTADGTVAGAVSGGEPEAGGGEPLDAETQTMLLAYLDALADAKGGDRLAGLEVEELRRLLTEGDLSMLDDEDGDTPGEGGASLSAAEWATALAGTWRQVPAGTLDPKTGRKSRKVKWVNEKGRVVYQDPGQPRVKKPTPTQTKKASAREVFDTIEKGVKPSPEQMTMLLDRLQGLTVPQLRQLRQKLAASWGAGKAKNKEAMVSALRTHLRQQLEQAGIKPEEKAVEQDEPIAPDEEEMLREEVADQTAPRPEPEKPEQRKATPKWSDSRAGAEVGEMSEEQKTQLGLKYAKFKGLESKYLAEGVEADLAREDAQWESGLTDAELAHADREMGPKPVTPEAKGPDYKHKDAKHPVAKEIAADREHGAKVQAFLDATRIVSEGPDSIKALDDKWVETNSKYRRLIQNTKGRQAKGDLEASMQAELNAIDMEARQINAAIDKAKAQARQTLLEHFGHDNGEPATVTPLTATDTQDGAPLGAVTPQEQAQIDEATKFISSLVPNTNGLDIPIGRSTYGSSSVGTRAFARPDLGEVYLPAGDDAKFKNALIHEMAHILENRIPGLQQAAGEFVTYRTGVEKKSMNEVVRQLYGEQAAVGFREEEVGSQDDFGKLFPDTPRGQMLSYYMGKTYASGDTEIVSMGMELLHDDPIGFAHKDPEFFHWLTKNLTR